MSTQTINALPVIIPATGNVKLAAKFRKMADGLTDQIEQRRRPMTQNATPKRMKEYRSRLHDADNMERTQKALLALAEGHESGTLPDVLQELKTKDEIARLVYKSIDTSNSGYYDVIPKLDYHFKTPAALAMQSLIEVDVDPAAKAERERQQKISLLEADVQFGNIPGYFPTPASLASRLVLEADIRPGMTVLEPSAGKGNIRR